MSGRSATFVHPLVGDLKDRLDQRIDELRTRKPADLNHGQALLLQGVAAASLREQRIVAGQIDLD